MEQWLQRTITDAHCSFIQQTHQTESRPTSTISKQLSFNVNDCFQTICDQNRLHKHIDVFQYSMTRSTNQRCAITAVGGEEWKKNHQQEKDLRSVDYPNFVTLLGLWEFTKLLWLDGRLYHFRLWFSTQKIFLRPPGKYTLTHIVLKFMFFA